MELSLLNQDSTPQYICLKMCIYVFLKTEKYNFVCKICLYVLPLRERFCFSPKIFLNLVRQ